MKKLLFIIPSIIALVLLISILLVIYFCQTDIELEEGSVDDIFEIQLTDKEEQSPDEAFNVEKKEYIGRQPPEGYVEPVANDHRQLEFQLALKDTYQSNIVIILDDLYRIGYNDGTWIGLDIYEWLHLLSEFSPFGYGDTIFFLVYAILTYYDGNVPFDYYVNIEEDTHNTHPESVTIFELQTHGERPLNICIDMYNYKIRVEEGMKQKNPNCEQGCCD